MTTEQDQPDGTETELKPAADAINTLPMGEENDEPPVVKRGTPRDGMLDMIQKRRRSQVAEQIGVELPDPDQDPEPDPEPRQPAARSEPPTEETHDPQPEMVKVKVFDEESWVPREEVEAAGGLQAYQQTKAAEYNFELSKKMRAEARELLQAAQAPAPEVQPPAQPALAAAPAVNVGQDGLTDEQREKLASMSDDFAEEIVETTRLAYLNTTHIAAQAASGGRVDEDAIARKARDQVLEEQELKDWQKQRDFANAFFSKTYGDIEKDPYLKQIASLRIREEVAKPDNAGRPLIEIVKEAGDFINGKYLGRAPAKAGDVKDANPRVTQKRTRRVAQPGSSARATPPAKQEAAAPTRSQVIEQMRAARGQA